LGFEKPEIFLGFEKPEIFLGYFKNLDFGQIRNLWKRTQTHRYYQKYAEIGLIAVPLATLWKYQMNYSAV
jgi:hypothetical protein